MQLVLPGLEKYMEQHCASMPHLERTVYRHGQPENHYILPKPEGILGECQSYTSFRTNEVGFNSSARQVQIQSVTHRCQKRAELVALWYHCEPDEMQGYDDVFFIDSSTYLYACSENHMDTMLRRLHVQKDMAFVDFDYPTYEYTPGMPDAIVNRNNEFLEEFYTKIADIYHVQKETLFTEKKYSEGQENVLEIWERIKNNFCFD